VEDGEFGEEVVDGVEAVEFGGALKEGIRITQRDTARGENAEKFLVRDSVTRCRRAVNRTWGTTARMED